MSDCVAATRVSACTRVSLLQHSLSVTRNHERIRLFVPLDAADGLYERILHFVQATQDAAHRSNKQHVSPNSSRHSSDRQCWNSDNRHLIGHTHVNVLEDAVTEAQEHSEVIVALVSEEILLACVDVECRRSDLGASVEEVELTLVQAARNVGV
jgi:hypothetical protein